MVAPTTSIGRGALRQHRSIAVFERGERIGGRLYSVKPKGMIDQVAELGGMRIANNQTPLLNLAELLNLTLDPYPATEPDNFYYLRGLRTRAKNFVCSPEFGYHPNKAFEGMTNGELFSYLLKYLTGSTEWTRADFAAAKQSMTVHGHPLNDVELDTFSCQRRCNKVVCAR